MHRVRIFAPIFPLIQKNHAITFLSDDVLQWKKLLKWHYEATATMWTLFLLNDGGSKRFAWLGSPGPVLMKEAVSYLKSQTNTFEPPPGPSNLGGLTVKRLRRNQHKGKDCEVAAFHNFHDNSLPCTVQAAHGNHRYYLYLRQVTWKLNWISQQNLLAG